MLINLKSPRPVLVTISVMYHLSAIVFTLHEPIAVKLPLFRGGYPSLMPTCAEVEAGQTFLYNIAAAAAKFGQKISQPKTKVLSFGYDAPVITLDSTPLEVVPTCVYLGSSTSGDSITYFR